MGVACIHCGDDCGKHPVMWEEKPFCCNGCKTVYQILNQNELKQYYEIEKMPGIKIETAEVGDKYAYLDLEEIRSKLLDFSDGGSSKLSLFIPSIHCASCIWLLENLNTLNPGISQSMVNFPKKEVYITFKDDQISLRQVVELLASIHYIPEITLDRLEKGSSRKSNQTLLLKLGITGFVLMNVMMYNFPEYLPGGELLEENFRRYFGWLSLILSIPVVVYSSNDYYLSAIKSLKHKIISIDLPIALGILTLFGQSTYDIVTNTGIGYLDSLSGLIFFLLIGKWYQGKTYQALSFERDYKSYFPVAVTLIENEKEKVIPLDKLKEGNLILVRNQELIPADSKIYNGDGNIDYSFVTGESIPVSKKEGEAVFAGGRQVGSSIILEVVKEVEQSYLTQLWNQEKSADNYDSRLNVLINKVSQYFTIIILAIAFISGGYWIFTDGSKALFVFTSILIIACPCALALTVPFTFGSTLRQFGRRGFYLKKTDVIEQLDKVDCIVFDKTGTITQNRALKVEFVGEKLDHEMLVKIKSVVRHSTHPLSVGLFANLLGEDYYRLDFFKEIPGLGLAAAIDGKKINIGSEKFVSGKESGERGLKSLVYVFYDNRILGYFQLENQYRPGLNEVITDLATGFDLHLLTGDNEAEKENLEPIFGKNAQMFFKQTPTDKLNYVKALKAKGKKVLMVGDGLNDAGALNESDVGITIADDIYHFSPACDAILESEKFRFLNKYIRFTRSSLNVVKVSFVISFIYNIGGLFFAIQGLLTPVIAAILMPISSISVVAFATFSISFLAKRLFPN
ncbi:MAG: heavy metal translocating P-type ATPase metal-binding domain-containing protein [Bacteroidales bacterium]|nr:heavy metal translocating P-type ATPase metal-binding domain-containing protein [Bacteroidales bacterium]MCF8404547.1 heavy metal translocating P-type ATPase metal-binding domain-containing protein [Bacteroidales bacterium]